jgi:squalene-hopene/tetraprenyl-beta-curcumene cyclase
MRMLSRIALAAALPVLVACVAFDGQAQQPKEKKGFKSKSWDEVVDAAVGYLKTAQADDGSWSNSTHPGITGVVLTGLFRSGKVTADDTMGVRGLKFVEAMADTKEGHLAGVGQRHKSYLTSVNLLALKGSGSRKYDPVIAGASLYLKNSQIDEEDGKRPKDPWYGGFGYGPGTRPDLSNTHFVLDALKAAGVPQDDPVFKKAAVFVSRMQNLKSEHNGQPWAGKLNDGSFIYVQASGRGASDDPASARPGYGSMTCAGLKSLAYCGVSRDDPRVRKGLEWLSKNYSVDVNPGRQEGAGGQGYYYYLVALAKCLDALGLDEVTDASGRKHDWRAEITRALANRQQRNGSWENDFPTWLEGDPNLDTAYALIALSYTKPKAE